MMIDTEDLQKKMRKTNKDKILYAIDNIIAKGSFSIIIALFLVVILIIIILSLFIWSLGSNPSLGLMDQFWIYFNVGLGKDAEAAAIGTHGHID